MAGIWISEAKMFQIHTAKNAPPHPGRVQAAYYTPPSLDLE